LQITRTTPFLRITLQLRHILFTDAITFMIPSPYFARNTMRPRERS
jgi:hypothetical protein